MWNVINQIAHQLLVNFRNELISTWQGKLVFILLPNRPQTFRYARVLIDVEIWVTNVEIRMSLSCTQISSRPSQSCREIYSSVSTLLILNRTIITKKVKQLKSQIQGTKEIGTKTKTWAWMILDIQTHPHKLIQVSKQKSLSWNNCTLAIYVISKMSGCTLKAILRMCFHTSFISFFGNSSPESLCLISKNHIVILNTSRICVSSRFWFLVLGKCSVPVSFLDEFLVLNFGASAQRPFILQKYLIMSHYIPFCLMPHFFAQDFLSHLATPYHAMSCLFFSSHNFSFPLICLCLVLQLCWSHLWCSEQKLRHELGWHLIFQQLTTHLCS
jgi:hypothetical protein